jgi:hypothetical protein
MTAKLIHIRSKMAANEEKASKSYEENSETSEDIKDKHGNIKKKILDKMVDESIDKNILIYERLSEI